MAVGPDPVFTHISAGPPTTTETPTVTGSGSAKALIEAALGRFGLSSLASWAWTEYLNGASVEEVMLAIRDRPEYKLRFPAMDQLATAGRAISEESYIEYESTVRGLLQRYGFPSGMYDTPEKIAGMLVSDVSASEVNERLATAAAATFEYPAEVRQRLHAEFGAGPGDLAAYMMDPDLAVPIIQQRVKTAQVYGAADQQRVQIEREQAQRLAENGVTFEQARQGFGQVSATQGLAAGYGETIDQSDRIAAAFGDADKARKQQRVQLGRQAQFRGGGSAVETQQGVTGLGGASTR